MTKLEKVVESRVNGESLIDIRNGRVKRDQDWKDRIGTLDDLYQGNFKVAFPNEDYDTELPFVMNLVQVGIDDMARLVSETMPSITVMPAKDDDGARKKAYLQEAICETYWDVNDGNILTPRLAMDLAGAGAAFLVLDTAEGDYPSIHRVDPRYAYPDVYNGQLQDLLVVQAFKLREAARIFPRLRLEEVPSQTADGCEVVEYYSKNECIQAVGLIKNNEAVREGMSVIKRWKPEIGCVPVAFVQLDTYDGHFRGMFDQIAGALNTKNRIVKLLLDYTDRLTYAPKISKGLLNPEEEEGPNAHYRLDPNTPEAMMGRLQPAGPAPQLFAVLEFLEREQRGGTSYPAQRQGDVSQSIASASFVNSTMGQLTTSVRNIQRLLGTMRERTAKIAIKLDMKHMDYEKPLSRSIGDKVVYTPSSALTKTLRPKVSYGAGSGLDRMNADVRILQHLGAGLISRETAREQIDYLEKDGEEADRIAREMAETALAQKFLTEAPWDMVAKVYAAMDDGKSLSDAIKEVMESQPPAPASPTAEGLAPPGAPPGESPMSEQLALQKGKQQDVKFPNQPLTNILVSPSR